jgi:transcriptional regulator with XRE-family HTH domain
VALFFDADWFDARLADRGLTRDVLAAACGMSPADLALVFKDQRELSAAEVAGFAELLGVPAAEVARHAGVSTPNPDAPGVEDRVAQLEARVARLEALLDPAQRQSDRL